MFNKLKTLMLVMSANIIHFLSFYGINYKQFLVDSIYPS